ncbi:DJ-1/PfpI family protein [Mycobacteroides franklinii]|uniref:DJ-1/PfpI family protein n=1 Tax=Mycobacteroides franklinii TaxID=948102 RepID=UPI000991EDDD|nr:DJ-1/PfpI family protein [Mycobacteroides franklinii]
MAGAQREVSIVLFDGFELLDVFGPVELLTVFPDLFSVTLVGPEVGAVRSNQGPEVVATQGYRTAVAGDIVLVPGGFGTRRLVADRDFLSWLAAFSARAELVTSVCTGSALLAAAGLLDGYRATSNKRAFRWAAEYGSDVTWVAQARWVQDRDRWTSSGVAAGMDMTVALMRFLHGPDVADEASAFVEFEAQRDPDQDAFAQLNALL